MIKEIEIRKFMRINKIDKIHDILIIGVVRYLEFFIRAGISMKKGKEYETKTSSILRPSNNFPLFFGLMIIHIEDGVKFDFDILYDWVNKNVKEDLKTPNKYKKLKRKFKKGIKVV
jgi:hypothetical protein